MAGAVRDPVQLQPLDIRRLRHLRAAVRSGSLSGAAETLGLSQPALRLVPSTGRPMGFGRSRTHTVLPWRAASSSTYLSVVANV